MINPVPGGRSCVGDSFLVTGTLGPRTHGLHQHIALASGPGVRALGREGYIAVAFCMAGRLVTGNFLLRRGFAKSPSASPNQSLSFDHHHTRTFPVITDAVAPDPAVLIISDNECPSLLPSFAETCSGGNNLGPSTSLQSLLIQPHPPYCVTPMPWCRFSCQSGKRKPPIKPAFGIRWMELKASGTFASFASAAPPGMLSSRGGWSHTRAGGGGIVIRTAATGPAACLIYPPGNRTTDHSLTGERQLSQDWRCVSPASLLSLFGRRLRETRLDARAQARH
jgi:hypothetical protein